MAGTKDKTKLAAEKARKQKIIVGIGGVLLLAALAIQGPKLWKQINPPAANTTSSEAASQAVESTSATPPTALSTSKSTAVLAGVSISTASRSSRAVAGKLVTFTLFKAKDPFVPQVTTTSSSSTTAPESSSSSTSGSQPTSTSSAPAAQEPVAGSETTATAALPKPSFATIEINGKAESVALKGTFPAVTPTFVLVGLTHNGAKIGVAGGTIGGRKAIPVKMSKEITLVDSATRVRYALKLVYAGTAPEKVEMFNSGQPTGSTPTTAP